LCQTHSVQGEECSFKIIFGNFQGNRISASRKVAEKIEIQTRYATDLFYVDIRQDQFCAWPGDLFTRRPRRVQVLTDLEVPLTSLEVQVAGDPSMPSEDSLSKARLNNRAM